jgi:hypothetical protein
MPPAIPGLGAIDVNEIVCDAWLIVSLTVPAAVL